MVKKYETLAIIPILAVVYFCAAKVGLRFAFVHPSATALWALTGITLAAFLIFGLRVWPGIFLGAFLVNLSTVGTALTSIEIATGNTLEGVVGCYLINRFSRGQHTFDREQDIFKFALLAGVVSTTIPAHVEGGWAPRSGSARARSQPGLTGKETELWEIIYFKLHENEVPVVERALEIAALMLGSNKSRGSSLEMICADFPVGGAL